MDQDHMKKDESETALQWLVRLKVPTYVSALDMPDSTNCWAIHYRKRDHGCGKLDLAMTMIAEMLLSQEKHIGKLLSNISESDRVALLERVYIERVYTPDEMEASFCKMIVCLPSNNP
uniref:Uncharacterized protein n=1 Tax=Ditylenchus dipsaci TaxID=166011 RepID=A0A915CU00_9BILA